MRKSDVPKGRVWNLLEAMLVFLRDEVARPAIGHHDADRFLPFLWTMFFFVLFCNLFGLLPWAGFADRRAGHDGGAGDLHVRDGDWRRHDQTGAGEILEGAGAAHGSAVASVDSRWS